MNSRRQTTGFTLVEVLVALSIVAIGFAAIMRTIAVAIDTTADLRDRSMALIIAQNRYAEHLIKEDWPGPRTFYGEVDMINKTWFWKEQVATTDDIKLRRIDIYVSTEKDGHYLAHLEGLLRLAK